MKLDFEIVEEIGAGKTPDLLHLFTNKAFALYLREGKMFGREAKTELGEWREPVFDSESQILDISELSNFEVSEIFGFGAIGVIKSGDSHKLLIHESQRDI